MALKSSKMSVYSTILSQKQQSAKLLAILIDPDKEQAYRSLLSELNHADLILVGGSTGGNIEPCIAALRAHTDAPLVIFPGNVAQFSPNADALLFLTLLNARTADMLIDPHVQMAMPILQSGIESIPMGYILIDGGRKSSVEKVSHCTPIPQDEVDRIVSTAVAGQLLGKQLIYLEAGSGAKARVSTDIIRAHITHGSTVTYKVHCVRYLPPKVLVAAVIACISACAVTSAKVSVRLCPRPTTCPSATITHPTGTSPIAKAFCASANAIVI